MAYENVPLVYDANPRHPHVAHPHPAQHGKYGGVAGQGGAAAPGQSTVGYKQAGSGGVDPRERSHEMRDNRSHDGRSGGGAMDYQPPMTRPPAYSMGAGPRLKAISPASISVAYDAASSGDIATLVRS